jgi:hypothetical protein
MPAPASQFAELIRDVADTKEADFYREIWGTERSFASLPTVSREDFLRVPLSRRRFKMEKALVKVVHDPRGMFLSEWAFSDIAKESFGIVSARPLVYMANSGETLEKSMWCYGNGVVPLAGEKDPDIAMYAARKYRVNSVITDPASVHKIESLCKDHAPLESISILGTEFDVTALEPFRSYAASVRLVWALPETGAFAVAALSSEPRFEALPGCHLEATGETLIVSKLQPLVTPIIRYRTEIPSDRYDGA